MATEQSEANLPLSPQHPIPVGCNQVFLFLENNVLIKGNETHFPDGRTSSQLSKCQDTQRSRWGQPLRFRGALFSAPGRTMRHVKLLHVNDQQQGTADGCFLAHQPADQLFVTRMLKVGCAANEMILPNPYFS